MSPQGKSRTEAATEVVERLLVVTSGPMNVALAAPLIEDILPPEESDATVVVTDSVQNSGGDAAGPSTTRFYLSANLSLDASDLLLAGSREVPWLAVGASSSGSTAITIPAGTIPGYYYLFAVADGDGAVAEGQENNNAAARAIQVIAGP